LQKLQLHRLFSSWQNVTNNDDNDDDARFPCKTTSKTKLNLQLHRKETNNSKKNNKNDVGKRL
jgi:hypothetical protein